MPNMPAGRDRMFLGATARPESRLATSAPLLLLAAATLGLGVVQAQPRPGDPLALVFPAGVTEAEALVQVLAHPGWDPIALRRLGPFTLALVAPPSTADAAPPGAWFALPAFGRAPCTANTTDVPASRRG
ncbi:hypothetical protein ACVFYP_07935 [Roseomonas sp. F4]